MARKKKTVNGTVKSKPRLQKQIGIKVPVSTRDKLLSHNDGISACIRLAIIENINTVAKSSIHQINSVAAGVKGEKTAINFRVDSDLYDSVKYLSYRKSSTITSVVLNCLASGGFFDGID